ncbi:MAG: hypothetical protein JWO77_451 [Ilumatobacteraceae bacterium]|nr:hypothetical protein [Ilumatobacteraceae bacterium]
MDIKMRTAAVLATLLLAGAVASCGSNGVGSEDAKEAEVGEAASVDAETTRGDVDCDAKALGEDRETEFIDAYYVVDGQLGDLCFGDEDPTVTEAWESLTAITPPDQLNDLALFAGFVVPEGAEADEASTTTLAFVNAIDDEGTAFQMSVNLDAYDEEPEEADLTMAHEFSHVFTATQSQLDRSPEAFDACTTYLTSDGCYRPDSLMAAWIDRFGSSDDLAGVDPENEAEIDDGAELCAADPSFLGPYAASSPEEDFAESFAAFVYRVEAPTPEVEEKLDWLADQPGLVEFRDRAVEAGQGPLEGTFEVCGS